MLIDTHTHYTSERFDPDRAELLSALPGAGVLAVVDCASSEAEWPAVTALAAAYPHVYSALGIHGLEAETATKGYLKRLEQAVLADPKCVAIGEIGLDYHYSADLKELQKRLFAEQLSLAVSLDRPAIIHDREAHRDVFDAVATHGGSLRCALHCYSGSAELVQEYAPLGVYFGFGGSLTFKNNQKGKRAALAAPLDKLLLETDSPYLAPVPHRGKRNDSTLMREVCAVLAELRGMDWAEMARITTENARRLFGLGGMV